MTTPSGTISLSNVNTELGYSATALITMNDAAVRTLAGVGGSGTIISMSNLQNKSNSFSATISSNQTDLNLRTWALGAGWNGTSAATITVGSGVYIYATSTGTPGLTINGSWPGGVTLVNSGYIAGKGGDANGGSGGDAISLGVNCTITNNSYIGGGGGGGQVNTNGSMGGGGGAGGGAGASTSGSAGGGAGGGAGSAGSNGTLVGTVIKGTTYYWGGGGGGGRIFPGSGGAGGGGGNGGTQPVCNGKGGGAGGGGGVAQGQQGPGGAGGSSNNAGGSTGGPYSGGGGGGGWGASGGSTNGGGGGSGGKAIALNGYSVTQTGSGSTWGSVS